MIGGLDIFAEHQLEHDRRFEHPRNGRPELFQRHAERMQRSYRASRLGRISPAGGEPHRSSGRRWDRQPRLPAVRRCFPVEPTTLLAVVRLIWPTSLFVSLDDHDRTGCMAHD